MKKYISLSLIYIITILIVFYLTSLYKKSLSIIGDNQFENLGISEIGNTSYEKLYNNISNYSAENNTLIIYVTYFKKDFLNFEKELKKIIIDNNIDNTFVYIDIKKQENFNIIEQLIKDFGYKTNIKEQQLPIFLYYKDGKLEEIINNYNLNIEQVKNKLIELGVI